MLAVQADGVEVRTVEGLAEADGTLHPIQQAFSEEHGLQCGFCTPGFLMATYELLEEDPDPSEEAIRDVLGGQLCRCTGYQGILRAVHLAAARMRAARSADAQGRSAHDDRRDPPQPQGAPHQRTPLGGPPRPPPRGPEPAHRAHGVRR